MKDVIKRGDQLNRLLEKNSSKYFWISRWEKNIWEIFAQRRAGRGNFLFSSVFLSTTWFLNTQNFRLPRPALHVFFFDWFCKNIWNKALVVVDQLEVEFLNLDQNWAKTRPLLLKTFISLIFIAKRIVHWAWVSLSTIIIGQTKACYFCFCFCFWAFSNQGYVAMLQSPWQTLRSKPCWPEHFDTHLQYGALFNSLISQSSLFQLPGLGGCLPA